MALNRVFGLAVRKIRTQRGWSQEKFAEIANIHRTYVSSIELGKVSVSLEIAEKIANSFDLKLSVLINEAERISRERK